MQKKVLRVFFPQYIPASVLLQGIWPPGWWNSWAGAGFPCPWLAPHPQTLCISCWTRVKKKTGRETPHCSEISKGQTTRVRLKKGEATTKGHTARIRGFKFYSKILIDEILLGRGRGSSTLTLRLKIRRSKFSRVILSLTYHLDNISNLFIIKTRHVLNRWLHLHGSLRL